MRVEIGPILRTDFRVQGCYSIDRHFAIGYKIGRKAACQRDVLKAGADMGRATGNRKIISHIYTD